MTEIEAALGHRFGDRSLLEEALTHASASGPGGRGSLERLEFLGDRVLALALASMLLRAYPHEAPGDLARRHATLASRDALVEVGLALGLHHHMRIQRGFDHERDALPPSMIEDACEAVIGAVYLDSGHDAAIALVERFWVPMIGGLPPRDAKTALQEWVQARALPLPAYELVTSDGPAHDPVFTVEVRIEGFEPVRAAAGSKRAAERVAAQGLLEIVAGDDE